MLADEACILRSTLNNSWQGGRFSLALLLTFVTVIRSLHCVASTETTQRCYFESSLKESSWFVSFNVRSGGSLE